MQRAVAWEELRRSDIVINDLFMYRLIQQPAAMVMPHGVVIKQSSVFIRAVAGRMVYLPGKLRRDRETIYIGTITKLNKQALNEKAAIGNAVANRN